MTEEHIRNLRQCVENTSHPFCCGGSSAIQPPLRVFVHKKCDENNEQKEENQQNITLNNAISITIGKQWTNEEINEIKQHFNPAVLFSFLSKNCCDFAWLFWVYPL